MNATATTKLANVPHPAGATDVSEWDTAYETPGRYFTGKKWPLSRREAEVLICGFQRVDGRDERFVNLMDRGTELLTELTADEAREIGLALIAAADEVDQVNSFDREQAPQLDISEMRDEVRALMRGVHLRDLTDEELSGIIDIFGPARLRVADNKRPV